MKRRMIFADNLYQLNLETANDDEIIDIMKQTAGSTKQKTFPTVPSLQ